MREFRAEMDLDAPFEQVWRAVTDFDAYLEWNPFIRSIDREAEVGALLTIRGEPPDARATTFRPAVHAMDHRSALEPLAGGRSRFVETERFSGMLVGVLRSTPAATVRGFEQMNHALMRRAGATS